MSLSMKHRWMDAVKSALAASSPRSDASATTASGSSSAASAKGARHQSSSNNPQPLHARRSFALALPGIATAAGSDDTSDADADAPERESLSALSSMGAGVAFVHFSERCESVGACSVAKVLELCMLQGGVHHTHMNILTYLGSPLRVDTCCYAMSVQWFRALGEHGEFHLIPDACDEWFTPTADDIGAKILAKVAMQDEDAVRTKLLEYGPIKEDPEVRSKVETYLERRSVLFMGLESLAVQDGGEHYPNNIDMRESWTLLIDDRRVRLTCESSLLPPFEGFYTSSIRVEILRFSPHEFLLYLADNCYVHLRAESNTVRDIIVLTLRAFCRSAVSSELINDAISKGLSPMLTIRTLAAAEQQQNGQQPANGHGEGRAGPVLVKSPPAFSLPWNQPSVGAGAILIDEDDDSVEDESEGGRPSETGVTRLRSASESLSVASSDFFNDAVLQDAEALIGNAMKMGLQNHLLLPKAPKRISVAEIPDLQIIEAIENNDEDSVSMPLATPGQRRRLQSSKKALSESGWRSRSSSLDVQASVCMSESQHSGGGDETGDESVQALPEADGESLEDAIRQFQRQDFEEIEALRSQYVAIFCEMQRELSESKARAKSLSARLNETTDENRAFRSDIALLQDALSSAQIADKVREVVASDLRRLVDKTARPKTSDVGDTASRDLYF